MSITGTIVYNNFEGGFYGIEADNGNQYLPVNLPEQLKYPGRKVKLEIVPADVVSMLMWGEPVRIISFSTLMP